MLRLCALPYTLTFPWGFVIREIVVLRNFCSFNFWEYVAYFVLRPVTNKMSWCLFLQLKTNSRELVHRKTFNVYGICNRMLTQTLHII